MLTMTVMLYNWIWKTSAQVERKARQWFRRVTKQRKLTREVVKCVAKLKSTKTAGADKIVNEFMNYGGEGMLTMMVMLFNWMWKTSGQVERRSSSKLIQERRQR